MLWPDLPDPRELKPWWRKLEAHPGSAIILTIETRAGKERPVVKVGWLSPEERARVRKTIIEISIERGRRNQLDITDPGE
jgi:hypothetical protein